MKWFWTVVGALALVSSLIELWQSDIGLATKGFLSVFAITGVVVFLVDKYVEARAR